MPSTIYEPVKSLTTRLPKPATVKLALPVVSPSHSQINVDEGIMLISSRMKQQGET